MTRKALLLSGALPLWLGMAPGAVAQTAGQAQGASDTPAPVVQTPLAQAPAAQSLTIDAPADSPTPIDPDRELSFEADVVDYAYDDDIVTAHGNVLLRRRSDELRADQVTWNRATGSVVAEGNIVIVNSEGDAAYGDRIELTDTLKDGVIENMLVVLDAGGRIAAQHGTRNADGVISVDNAAYTPCAVANAENCPKEPSWKITANHVVYNPETGRMRYSGARVSVFGFVSVPLPVFSHPVGGRSDDGFLAPSIRYTQTNRFEVSTPYFFSLTPNRDLTVTPTFYSVVAPMLRLDYRELNSLGAFRVTGYGTYSRRSDDLTVPLTSATSREDFRGYLNIIGNYQLDTNWSVGTSLRLTTDRTFLRRYDISRDDRLRNNVNIQRVDSESYFAINAWGVQTLRIGESQGMQPIALPEIDYRRRINEGVFGGVITAQVNSLAITRTSGQDTQRAFASARWDLRRLTPWGQEVVLTAYARGDVYNTSDTLATTVTSYRGLEGFRGRAIGAVAIDMRWPLIGPAFGGTQRITPRFQVVAAPHISNLDVPNEDARAVDLEDSNLFALNRFPGYDRFEDSTRFTWGMDYALYLPRFSIDANIGQSYRLTSRQSLFPDGTGLSDRVSDFVGRTEIRYGDFLSLTHRYRIDKDNFTFRRNEIDATIGTRSTYFQIGYLRLNRDISSTAEDLQDREEARVGGRIQIARFWSVSGAALVDLTGPNEDPTTTSDGFAPVRHRLGIMYEDDCLRLGLTWKRDYEDTGDARAGNSYTLTLTLKNLGR